jgi:hypothetical protein
MESDQAPFQKTSDREFVPPVIVRISDNVTGEAEEEVDCEISVALDGSCRIDKRC